MRIRQALTSTLLLICALITTSLPRPAGTSPRSRAIQPNARKALTHDGDGLTREALPRGAGQFITLTAGRKTAAAAQAAPDHVSYTSFGGQTYTLNRFTARYTQTLLPDSWANGTLLTPAELRRLIDSQDLTYAYYKELTGAEPKGDGLLTIAYVPLANSDFLGLGLVGSKGVEISDDPQTAERVKTELISRTTFSPADHELAHDFDLVSKYTAKSPADGHAWTALLQSSLPLLSRDRTSELEPDEALKLNLAQFDRYLASAYDWNALLAQSPQDLPPPNVVWSGSILRLIQLKGTGFLRRYVAAVRTLSATAAADQQQSPDDLHLRAIAAALNENSLCIASAWRWPVSPAASALIQSDYGPNPSTLCQDNDHDTFTPLAGDTNDEDPTVNPSRVETPNGRDDDSNTITDDVPVSETSLSPSGDLPESPQSAPTLNYGARLEATIQSDTDVDTVRIQIPATSGFADQVRHITINARTTTSNAEIQIEPLYSNGQSTGTFIYADWSKIPVRHHLSVIAGQEWTLRIKRSSATPYTAPFGYQLSVCDADSYPTTPPTLLAAVQSVASNPDGTRRLTAAWTDDAWQGLRAQGVTHVRWWITGSGWSALQPASQSPAFNWAPPATPTQSVYGYRIQPIRHATDGTPDVALAPASQPAFFTDPDSGPADQPPATQPTAPIPRLPPLPTDARPAPSRRTEHECLSPSSITRIALTAPGQSPPTTATGQPTATDQLGLAHFPSQLQGWTVSFDGNPAEILGYEQTGLDPNNLQPRLDLHVLTPDAFGGSSTQIAISLNGQQVSAYNTCTQIISPALWTDPDGYAVALTSPEQLALDATNGLPPQSLFNSRGRNISLFGTGFRKAPNSDPANDLPGRQNVAESFTPAVLIYTDGTNRQALATIDYVGPALNGPAGLDQIIVNIPSSVTGTNTVELHIITSAGTSLPVVDVKVKLRLN